MEAPGQLPSLPSPKSGAASRYIENHEPLNVRNGGIQMPPAIL